VQKIDSLPQSCNLPIISSTIKKPQKTKHARMKELNAAWKPLAHLVSNSEVESTSLIESITDRFWQATISLAGFLNKGKGKSNDQFALEDFEEPE